MYLDMKTCPFGTNELIHHQVSNAIETRHVNLLKLIARKKGCQCFATQVVALHTD